MRFFQDQMSVNADILQKTRKIMRIFLGKRTYVPYNDARGFVALCEKIAKNEYRCQHIERVSRPTTPAVS